MNHDRGPGGSSSDRRRHTATSPGRDGHETDPGRSCEADSHDTSGGMRLRCSDYGHAKLCSELWSAGMARALADDGNRHEVIGGDLAVTPLQLITQMAPIRRGRRGGHRRAESSSRRLGRPASCR